MDSSLPSFFKKSADRKQVHCLICNCWLPSTAEKFLSSHVSGRKHKYEVEKQSRKEHILKCSVYVKGYDPQIESLEEKLKSHFEDTGVTVKDIYVDKNNGSYSIIELANEQDVNSALTLDKTLFHEKKLFVRRREEKKRKALTDTSSNLKSDEKDSLLKEIKTILMDDDECPLDSQMEKIFKSLQLSEDDISLRHLICDLLLNVLEELHPNCQVEMFGSSVNGLGLKGCDIDITVLPATENTVDDTDENCTMKEIREVIQRFAPGCKSVQYIEPHRTCAIVKFCHSESKLNVDLSWNNSWLVNVTFSRKKELHRTLTSKIRLAVQNTKLLQNYLNYESRVKPLIFSIRIWAKLKNISGKLPTQLTNYTWTLMVIFFLQRVEPPILPCLQENTKGVEPLMIGPWDCTYDKHAVKMEKSNASTLGDLILQFINYYMEFDFKNTAINIKTNKVLSREEAKKSAEEVDNTDTLNTEVPLVVQDPFKLSHNVAQNLSDNGFQIIYNHLKKAHTVWQERRDFLALFDEEMSGKKQTRSKQKHKRNRSSVYSMTLPNCSHVKKETSNLCCYDLIMKILIEKLQMQQIQPICNDKKVFIEDNVKYIITADIQQVPGSKRKHSDDTIDENSSKKQKCESKNQTFIFIATKETWVNRRKEKRHKLHVASTDEALNGSMIAEDEAPQIQQQEGSGLSEPAFLFKFSLHLQPSQNEDNVCRLTLEPIDLKEHLQAFQTFYAFFKKELITTMQ